jgi:hypothetical protein
VQISEESAEKAENTLIPTIHSRLLLSLPDSDLQYDADYGFIAYMNTLISLQDVNKLEYFSPSIHHGIIPICYIRKQYFHHYMSNTTLHPFQSFPYPMQWYDDGEFKIGVSLSSEMARFYRISSAKLAISHALPLQTHDILVLIIKDQRYYLDCLYSDKFCCGEILQKTLYGEVYRGEEKVRVNSLNPSISEDYSFLHPLPPKKVVIKTIHIPRCHKVSTTCDLAKVYKPSNYINENILYEVEIMSFLHLNLHSYTEKHFLTSRNVIQDGTNLYLVSSYYENGCLFDYICEKQANLCVLEREIAYIIQSIAHSIHILHSYGIAHQDISAENILLSSSQSIDDEKGLKNMNLSEFRLILCDFG